MFRRSLAFLASALLALPALAGQLGMGDPAPALEVQWVKGEPVAALAPDQTYVVEFWATWCGPCRKSIPHLSELQKKYEGKATFIGVSVWERDQAKVAPFVESMGDQMAYRVAMDKVVGKDGKMASAWMQAAGQTGIPAAFIVHKGTIAWIGHPAEIDEPLARVVAGGWDVAKAKKDAEEAKKGEDLYVAIRSAFENADWKATLTHADELIAAVPTMEVYVGPMRYTALLGLEKLEDASAYGRKFLAGAGKDNAQALNALAWMVVDPEAKRAKPDLELALAAATRANELAEGKDPGVLDTLARVHFAKGDVKKAIELQEKAVELAKGTGWEQELARRLEEYRGAAKS